MCTKEEALKDLQYMYIEAMRMASKENGTDAMEYYKKYKEVEKYIQNTDKK